MRIDPFLLRTKIITRLSKVKELIDTQSILVNGKHIKSSYNIKAKDLLKVIQEKRIIEVEIMKLPESKDCLEFSENFFSVTITKVNENISKKNIEEAIDFLIRE